MGFGHFDDREHERREKKISEIMADSEEQAESYQGKVTFDAGDSTEDLLDRLKEMKRE